MTIDRTTEAWKAKYTMWLKKGYTGERYTHSFKQFSEQEAAAAADRSVGSQQLGSQFWQNSDYAGAEPSQATKEAFSGAEYAYAWKEEFKQNIASGMERDDGAYRAYIDAMPVQRENLNYDPTTPQTPVTGFTPGLVAWPGGELPGGVTSGGGEPIPLFVVVGGLLLAAFLLLGR